MAFIVPNNEDMGKMFSNIDPEVPSFYTKGYVGMGTFIIL